MFGATRLKETTKKSYLKSACLITPFGSWNQVNPTIFEICLLYENKNNKYLIVNHNKYNYTGISHLALVGFFIIQFLFILSWTPLFFQMVSSLPMFYVRSIVEARLVYFQVHACLWTCFNTATCLIIILYEFAYLLVK